MFAVMCNATAAIAQTSAPVGASEGIDANAPGVILRFTVDPDGSVDLSTVRILESSGNADMDDAARERLRTMRFAGGSDKGEPLPTERTIRIAFGSRTQGPAALADAPVIAPVPDTVLVSTAVPCEGIPVLTQAGPRTLRMFIAEGGPEALVRAWDALVAEGVPAELMKTSLDSGRLEVRLRSNLSPSGVLAVYQHLEDGTFGPVDSAWVRHRGGSPAALAPVHGIGPAQRPVSCPQLRGPLSCASSGR
jgi:TonB family protein